MRINQNIAAFNAYRNLSMTQGSLGRSLEKLSSGYRINRACDDAAGLVKSESLRAEVGGTRVAIRNAQDGVSFIQTSEGALNEVHSILQRVRDLAVDASNTATTDGAPQQAEIDELLAELDAIGNKSTFAGNQVFDGSARSFQVGAYEGAENQISFTSLALSSAALGNNAANLSAIDVTSLAGATGAISAVDAAIDSVSLQRADLGAFQNRLEHTINNLNVAAENLAASESRIRDADMASEMVTFTRNQILQQAGTAMLAQANQIPQSVLSLLR